MTLGSESPLVFIKKIAAVECDNVRTLKPKTLFVETPALNDSHSQLYTKIILFIDITIFIQLLWGANASLSRLRLLEEETFVYSIFLGSCSAALHWSSFWCENNHARLTIASLQI